MIHNAPPGLPGRGVSRSLPTTAMDPATPIYLCGPTASGKSTLALELAQRLDGEIVNADAFQLYRGLETLTAAPSPKEQATLPHHLYGVLSPEQNCDAMHYRSLALPVIADIHSRGKTPIVTGGSGLYLKFLTHGPSPLPSGDPATRKALDQLSLDQLVERIEQLDPTEAARSDLKNRRYLTRIIEICQLSGQPCSTLRDQWESKTRTISQQLRGLFIQRQRPDLHQRIARRTHSMLSAGAIDEVAALANASSNFEKAIGFHQIRELIAGDIDRPRCIELIEAATRQYAKRQETWFRREHWLRPLIWEPQQSTPIEAAIEAIPNKL